MPGQCEREPKKYSTQKLVFLSVSADADDQAWRGFVAKKNMDWMQYRDGDPKILHAFGIRVSPRAL